MVGKRLNGNKKKRTVEYFDYTLMAVLYFSLSDLDCLCFTAPVRIAHL